MSQLLDRLLNAPGWVVLVITGLLVFAEDALFMGFVLPGETAALLAGVAANLGHAPLPAVLAVVVIAAIVGDSVGYEVGRRLGPQILAWRILDRRRDQLQRAQDFLARRGGSAVFLGRWVAFFRAVMPALAGAARMPYPRFLAYNAAGGLTWGTAVVLAGYLAGASYRQVEHVIGRDAALIAAALVILALLAWRVRHRRHPRS